MFDACQQVGNRFFAGVGGIAKNYFVGIFQAEGNYVTVLEFAAFYFFPIYEEAAPLAAIFQIKAIGFGDDGGAISRNAPVGKLQMIAGLRAAPDMKRSLGNAREPSRAVRRHNFQNRFSRQGHGIRHRRAPGGDCNTHGQKAGPSVPRNRAA